MEKVVNGFIVPSSSTLAEVLKQIKEKALKSETFNERWKSEPMQILAESGVSKPLIHELLIELGDTTLDINAFDGCYGCTGCCCSGCCISGIG